MMQVLIACEESQTVCMAFRARGHEAYSGLPPLEPTDVVEPLGLWVGSSSSHRDAKKRRKYKLTSIRNSKKRAKTFPGIAAAMPGNSGGDLQCE